MSWDKVKIGYRKFQIIWLVCCVLLLAVCLVHANSPDCRDNDILLILVMLPLTFPTGWLAVFVLDWIPWSANAYVHLPIDWAIFFIAGCVQWFGLIPLLAGIIAKRFPQSGNAD